MHNLFLREPCAEGYFKVFHRQRKRRNICVSQYLSCDFREVDDDNVMPTIRALHLLYYLPKYTAVTNARFASFHGLPVVPVLLSTTPVPLRKTARSSQAAILLAATAAAFRLRLGGGVALRLRSRRLSVCAPLFPLADRRPKPDSYLPRAIRRCSTCRSNNSRVRPTSAASAASLGNAVRYSRTSILLCNPSIA